MMMVDLGLILAGLIFPYFNFKYFWAFDKNLSIVSIDKEVIGKHFL